MAFLMYESTRLYSNKEKCHCEKGFSPCAFRTLALIALVIGFIPTPGCVPTPSGNTDIQPKITDLHSFFTPVQTGKIYLWHHIPLPPQKDSAYFLDYIGHG